MGKTIKTALKLFGLFMLFSEALFAATSQSYYRELLNQYLQNGFVDYRSIRESPGLLQQAFEEFQLVEEGVFQKWGVNEQKAFWVNAYNLAVIKIITDHYPLGKGLTWKALAYPSNSIQQIPDVWDRKVIRALGKERSLNEIEHEILRKEFKDARIHFALVCASLGCPVLRSEPYDGAKLDSQLNDQVRTFLTTVQKARYDKDSDALYLSPIFKWFRMDFEPLGGALGFVSRYWPSAESKSMSAKTQIKWLDYDWSLNEKR